MSAAWPAPTRSAAAWHGLKVGCHILLRGLRNLAGGPRRIAVAHRLTGAPVLAEQRSPLWLDGRADEFLLRCGKVQNLRVAVRAFHGIEVSPGQTLSFWAQVGRPTGRRGFVVGREIVNGCVVPTLGGGLCQLSNALAAVALAAGARLVERHRHSALIEAQATPAEDATVAWNHVDLRIAADFAFRIEAELTGDELLLRLCAAAGAGMAAPAAPSSLSSASPTRSPLPPLREARAVARGCLTCEQTSCFRHGRHAAVQAGRTAFLLNDRSPELAVWLDQQAIGSAADWLLPWVRPGLRQRAWLPPAGALVQLARGPSWRRIVRQRLLPTGEGGARQAERQRTAADLARHYARRLRPEHTELVVAQDLLVPLWQLGVLAGRQFDVHLHELPATALQQRLDAAAALAPDAGSLRDFRVHAAWQRDEWQALARARRRLTAHHEIARSLQSAGLSAELLPWVMPALPVVGPRPGAPGNPPGGRRPGDRRPGNRLTLTLAASALPRKGALEVASVARALDADLLILGSPPAKTGDSAAWDGIRWQAAGYASDWLARSDAVLLPAHVEHQPRALLQALAAGVPVIASPACGLAPQPGLHEVAPGDVSQLQALVCRVTDFTR